MGGGERGEHGSDFFLAEKGDITGEQNPRVPQTYYQVSAQNGCTQLSSEARGGEGRHEDNTPTETHSAAGRGDGTIVILEMKGNEGRMHGKLLHSFKHCFQTE